MRLKMLALTVLSFAASSQAFAAWPPVGIEARVNRPSAPAKAPVVNVPAARAAVGQGLTEKAPAPAMREFSDPGALGPYGIGVKLIEIETRFYDAPLRTLVWYPAEVDPAAAPYVYVDDPEFGGALASLAVENAPVVEERDPFPAVVFSHGNGGMAYQSIFLTEYLASHGYVVISTDHPGNTWFDYDPTTFVTGLFTRPRDISQLIDELDRMNREPASGFAGRIDMDRVGMSGHSFGGYTTLAVAGARLNLTAPTLRCERTGDPEACLFKRTAKKLTGRTRGLHDLSDPRVKAAVPHAPWAWEPFRAEGLAYLNRPLQVHGGGMDDICPMEKQIEPVWTYAAEPKSMLELFEAGHYTYSDICLALPDQFPDCEEPFIDVDLAHHIVNLYTLSHFKVFLEADYRYEQYLTPEYAATWSDEAAWSYALGL